MLVWDTSAIDSRLIPNLCDSCLSRQQRTCAGRVDVSETIHPRSGAHAQSSHPTCSPRVGRGASATARPRGVGARRWHRPGASGVGGASAGAPRRWHIDTTSAAQLRSATAARRRACAARRRRRDDAAAAASRSWRDRRRVGRCVSAVRRRSVRRESTLSPHRALRAIAR